MIRFASMPQTRRRQCGVGMIEVLIAVLIVSIGFLGMAALQARALSTNNSAMARSMATVASYSILDAMRADLTSVEANAYNQTVTADSCPNAGNTLASVQLNLWCQQLGASLGAVATTQGTIQCGGTAQCTVTITFDDSRASDKGVASGTKTVTIKTVAQL